MAKTAFAANVAKAATSVATSAAERQRVTAVHAMQTAMGGIEDAVHAAHIAPERTDTSFAASVERAGHEVVLSAIGTMRSLNPARLKVDSQLRTEVAQAAAFLDPHTAPEHLTPDHAKIRTTSAYQAYLAALGDNPKVTAGLHAMKDLATPLQGAAQGA